jgi:hypothetical protein
MRVIDSGLLPTRATRETAERASWPVNASRRSVAEVSVTVVSAPRSGRLRPLPKRHSAAAPDPATALPGRYRCATEALPACWVAPSGHAAAACRLWGIMGRHSAIHRHSSHH